MCQEVDVETLFLRHPPGRAELALVLGHRDPGVAARRARHAAGLYGAGLVPRLLLSGGPVAAGASEASLMARVARAGGVPESALLLEEHSRNTFENAEHALLLLQEQGLLDGLGAVLLVSCPWHMRRAFLVVRRTFPGRVRLLCCPQEETCTERTWLDTAGCRRCVAGELRLLRRLVGAGLIRP